MLFNVFIKRTDGNAVAFWYAVGHIFAHWLVCSSVATRTTQTWCHPHLLSQRWSRRKIIGFRIKSIAVVVVGAIDSCITECWTCWTCSNKGRKNYIRDEIEEKMHKCSNTYSEELELAESIAKLMARWYVLPWHSNSPIQKLEWARSRSKDLLEKLKKLKLWKINWLVKNGSHANSQRQFGKKLKIKKKLILPFWALGLRPKKCATFLNILPIFSSRNWSRLNWYCASILLLVPETLEFV